LQRELPHKWKKSTYGDQAQPAITLKNHAGQNRKQYSIYNERTQHRRATNNRKILSLKVLTGTTGTKTSSKKAADVAK